MLEPLSGHAVLLLLVQLTLLLTTARLGSELAQRLGLPSVVGELAAGILLGPTVLGHYSPDMFAMVFPQDANQFHLLEVVGILGMVLLLLLTGLETDLRLLKNLGRAALIASFMGMAIPFGTGYLLGEWMPDAYLAQPDKRTLFSFFLATGMSISAMPVIAKILIDLDLTKRNIGLVILSAGVIDDTAGWLILSVIAGAASHGEVQVAGLLTTVLLTGAFVGVAAFVVYPTSRWLIRIANRNFKTEHTDLLFVLVITFICASVTEWIGVHAVFGAFIAGTLFRQITHLKTETVHRLESFVFTMLAPVFFGIVGLKVDLWKLGGGQMLGTVLAVACLGKLIGCTIGSMWGGLRFWEGLSIAVAMNARGAMELVVATIGLSLGILNQEMFSIIVVVAIVTSFLAPLGLRLTMRMVRLTQEEVNRMVAEQTKGLFDPDTLHVLMPTTGFSNAVGAIILGAGLAKRSVNPVDVLLIETGARWWTRLIPFRFLSARSHELNEDVARQQLTQAGLPPTTRTLHHHNIAEGILEEAHKGKDVIVLGASRHGDSLGGSILETVIQKAPCHVVIVKEPRRHIIPNEPFQKLLVPFDGGVFSRAAVELAVRYAESTNAEVTLAMMVEKSQSMRLSSNELPHPENSDETLDDELLRVSTIFHSTTIKPSILRLTYGLHSSALIEEATSGRYDLVVLGTENRAVQNRLFFGYDNERLIGNDAVVVAVVVPNVTMLTKDQGLTDQLDFSLRQHGTLS